MPITGMRSRSHKSSHSACGTSACAALRAWRIPSLSWILALTLSMVHGVTGLDVEGDGLARQGLHEDLHATSQAQHQVEGGLLLDVVIRKGAAILQLLACKDQALLVRWDPLLVLDLGLDIVNGVTGLDVEGDGLARQGLHEDLHGFAICEFLDLFEQTPWEDWLCLALGWSRSVKGGLRKMTKRGLWCECFIAMAITAVTRLAVTCTRKGYANIPGFPGAKRFWALEETPQSCVSRNKRNKYCLLLPVPWLCHFDNRKLVVCYSSPVGWVDIQDGLWTGLSVESRTKSVYSCLLIGLAGNDIFAKTEYTGFSEQAWNRAKIFFRIFFF